MRGLAAWLVTYWLISFPLTAASAARLEGVAYWVSLALVVIISWTLANQVERAVNRHYANKEAHRG